MASSSNCPFCGLAMQSGVILDRMSGTNVRPIWIPEPAETSWFGSLREPKGPQLLVVTYRCPTCGFLASFAQPDSPEPGAPSPDTV